MDNRQIGSTLVKRRKLLGVNQQDLAEIAEISERTLREIENGQANPELKSLMKLCDVLGLTLKIEVKK